MVANSDMSIKGKKSECLCSGWWCRKWVNALLKVDTAVGKLLEGSLSLELC